MSPSSTAKPSAASRAEQIRRQRARRLLRAVAIWVGVPTLLAIIYYGIVAADQYESVTLVAVQSSDPGHGGLEALSKFVPEASGGSARDAALVEEIVRSRAMMEQLARDQNLLAHYRSGGDFVSRLGKEAGTEATFEYYRDKVRINAGSAATLDLRVRAFDPAKAQAASRAIVEHAEQMLNQVVAGPDSSQSRRRLMIISGPSLPNEATYPRRVWGVATVFVLALALAGVMSMLIGAVREHAKF